MSYLRWSDSPFYVFGHANDRLAIYVKNKADTYDYEDIPDLIVALREAYFDWREEQRES